MFGCEDLVDRPALVWWPIFDRARSARVLQGHGQQQRKRLEAGGPDGPGNHAGCNGHGGFQEHRRDLNGFDNFLL